MLMLPVNALVKGLNQVSMNDPLLEGWMGVSPAELARYRTMTIKYICDVGDGARFSCVSSSPQSDVPRLPFGESAIRVP